MKTETAGHFDLAAKLPISEEAWQRACEIEQASAHLYFKSRAENGFSVAATIYGTLVALGLSARIVLEPEAISDLTKTLTEAFSHDL